MIHFDYTIFFRWVGSTTNYIYIPSFDFFSFLKYLHPNNFPPKDPSGTRDPGGTEGLHVSVAFGPWSQVDVALLALARALWRGRFPEIRGPGSAALEATRKTMRTTGKTNDGG